MECDEKYPLQEMRERHGFAKLEDVARGMAYSVGGLSAIERGRVQMSREASDRLAAYYKEKPETVWVAYLRGRHRFLKLQLRSIERYPGVIKRR